MPTVTLLDTYSRLGTTPAGSSGGRLSVHQEKTIAALKDPNIEVVFNTAMTGDGKSLAAYWRSLTEDDFRTAGLYPTNELARDQENQLDGYIRAFRQTKFPPNVRLITGRILREHAALSGVSRQTELVKRVQSGHVLISNPDINHYIFNFFHRRTDQNPDNIFQRLAQGFRLTVFDEFHVFRAPQIASVVNSMLLARRSQGVGKKTFLFLSATPSTMMREMLDRVGIRSEVVTGEYAYADGTPPDPQAWRKILRGVSLSFEPILSTSEQTAEAWIKERFESHILPFFLENAGAKGAVIVSSVAAAKRLTGWLKNRMTPHGLTVESNTGFDAESTRRRSYDADLLVGTSTIDVGVDFKINFLVFEASDAGSFLQRFGRLGRHDGCTRLGGFVRFETFRAFALLPHWVCGTLFDPSKNLLRDGEPYDRGAFAETIRDDRVFPTANEFRSYARVWGSLQAAGVFKALTEKTIRNTYAPILEKLKPDYEAALPVKNLVSAVLRLAALKTEKRPIVDEAISFRGTSPLACAVLDESESKPDERFKTYDLPTLLSNWEILDVPDKNDFLERARLAGVRDLQPLDQAAIHLRIGKLREERFGWRFYLNRDASGEVQDAVVLTGLEISPLPGSRFEYTNEINKHLRRQHVVAFLVRGNPNETKIRRALPALFRLYPLVDINTVHDPRPSFGVAFGQEALQLASLFWKKDEKSENAVIC